MTERARCGGGCGGAVAVGSGGATAGTKGSGGVTAGTIKGGGGVEGQLQRWMLVLRTGGSVGPGRSNNRT